MLRLMEERRKYCERRECFLCEVTCSEVIAQQTEHPLGENAGGEQVVTVVVHGQLGPHLEDRQKKHFLIGIIPLNSVQQVMNHCSGSNYSWKFHTVTFTIAAFP